MRLKRSGFRLFRGNALKRELQDDPGNIFFDRAAYFSFFLLFRLSNRLSS